MNLNKVKCEVADVKTENDICPGMAKTKKGETYVLGARTPEEKEICCVAFSSIASIMLQNGVSYQILSVFITTLLMVGIVTLPLEMKYFGIKISMLRNFLFFLGALVAGIIMVFFQ